MGISLVNKGRSALSKCLLKGCVYMCVKEEYNRVLIGRVSGIKKTEGWNVNEMLRMHLKG